MSLDPEVVRAAARFKAELLAGEERAVGFLADQYVVSVADIDRTLDKLLARMIAAHDAGEDLTPSWLYRQEQYRKLREQAGATMDALGKKASGNVDKSAREAIYLANDHAPTLIGLGLGDSPAAHVLQWGGLHHDAIVSLAGQLSKQRAPLRLVLERHVGAKAVDAVKSELITGLTLGRNPRVVARGISNRLGFLRYEMERVTRTEYLRAYRAANMDVFRQNSDVLEGWIWSASLDDRTCMSCWAQHGTFHSLDETLDDHPLGRCSPIPSTKPWSELGIDAPESRTPVATGEERFERMGAKRQRKVMGDAKYRAWKDDEFAFADLSKRTTDPVWGAMRSEAPLKDLVA